jgi:hypothetical protein
LPPLHLPQLGWPRAEAGSQELLLVLQLLQLLHLQLLLFKEQLLHLQLLLFKEQLLHLQLLLFKEQLLLLMWQQSRRLLLEPHSAQRWG